MSQPRWVYALVAYGIALTMAQTELAPIAVISSWGIALVVLIDGVQGGKLLSGLTSGLPAAPNPASQTPSQAAPVSGVSTTPTVPTGQAGPPSQVIGRPSN